MPNSSWARAGPFQVSIDFSPEGSDRRRAFYFLKKKNFWTFFFACAFGSLSSFYTSLSLPHFLHWSARPADVFPFVSRFTNRIAFSSSANARSPSANKRYPFLSLHHSLLFLSLSTTNHQIRRPALPCVPDLISSSFLTHSPLCPRLLFLLPDRTQWNIAKRDDSRRQSTRWLEPNLLLSKASFDPIIANSFFLSVALRLTASSLPNNSALYNPRIWWGFKRLEREKS